MSSDEDLRSLASLWSGAEVRAAHNKFLDSLSDGEGERRRDEEIRALIEKIQASGATIEEEGERQAAQRILDYWAAELLVNSEADPTTWSPPKLAEPVPHDQRATADGSSESGVDQPDSQTSREQVRISALARQWRSAKNNSGYLLTGGALKAAAKFRERDPLIAEFLSASEAAEIADTRRTRLRYQVAIGILSTALLIAVASTYWALNERKIAFTNWQEAEGKRSELSKQLAINKQANLESRAANETLQAQLRQLEDQQSQLDSSIDVISRSVARGEIQLSTLRRDVSDAVVAHIFDLIQGEEVAQAKLPTDVRRAVEGIGPTPDSPLPPPNGFDPHFLGVALPLPRLGDESRSLAYEKDGNVEIKYFNYSLVINKLRRLPFFSGSNLDRKASVVLPRPIDLRVSSLFVQDIRLPANVQPEYAWFKDIQIDIGHLVSRQEVSWGPTLTGVQRVASRRLMQFISFAPNVTPQVDTFNRGIWSGLERWVLREHNPAADRVTIFSGPLLFEDPVTFEGVVVPSAFWKVAVSRDEKSPGELIVDAFLVRQIEGGKKIPRKPFTPDIERVPVAALERLTKLDFGSAVRRGKPSPAEVIGPISEADRLVAKIRLLDSPESEDRSATVRQIQAAFQSTWPMTEQRKVVIALANLTADKSIDDLSATGRLNLFFALGAVPAARWGDWADERTSVQKAIASLEARVASGATEASPMLRLTVDAVKVNLRAAESGSNPAPR